MGKFDGVLLVSDFDNTIVHTSAMYQTGKLEMPPVPPSNLEALRYFMDQGGRFCIATGRSWQIMRPFIHMVPTNGACGVANGAGIIHIPTQQFLYARFLPEDVLERVAEVRRQFPELTCEFFRADHQADAIHPIAFTVEHAKASRYTYRVISSPEETALPLLKVLFEGDPALLEPISAYIRSRPWFGQYELAFSGAKLLELTVRGANKGAMAAELARMYGVDPAHVYCAGDQENDLPMLRFAREGFAPANAVPAVLSSGVTPVCHCAQGALAEIIAILDRRY